MQLGVVEDPLAMYRGTRFRPSQRRVAALKMPARIPRHSIPPGALHAPRLYRGPSLSQNGPRVRSSMDNAAGGTFSKADVEGKPLRHVATATGLVGRLTREVDICEQATHQAL